MIGLTSPTLHSRYNLLPCSTDSLRAPLFSRIYQKHQSRIQVNQYPDASRQVWHTPSFSLSWTGLPSRRVFFGLLNEVAWRDDGRTTWTRMIFSTCPSIYVGFHMHYMYCNLTWCWVSTTPIRPPWLTANIVFRHVLSYVLVYFTFSGLAFTNFDCFSWADGLLSSSSHRFLSLSPLSHA